MGICIWDQKKQQTFSDFQILKGRCPVKLGLHLWVEKRYNSREKSMKGGIMKIKFDYFKQ